MTGGGQGPMPVPGATPGRGGETPLSYAGFFGFFGLGGRFGVLSPMENLPASRGAPPSPGAAIRPGSSVNRLPVADTIADMTHPALRSRDGHDGARPVPGMEPRRPTGGERVDGAEEARRR